MILSKMFNLLCLRVILRLPLPDHVRTLLEWPIASRLLNPKKEYWSMLGKNRKILVGMEDILNRKILFEGKNRPCFWEPSTTTLAQRIAEQSKICLLAGAHIGYEFIQIEKTLHPNGKIITFEPIPYLADRCQKTIYANRLESRITLRKEALSDSKGTVQMREDNLKSSITSMEEESTLTASCTTIDETMQNESESLSLLLLDIEGYEWEALHGARKTLEKNKPDCIIEIVESILKERNIPSEKIYGFLQDLGYTCYAIQDDYRLEKNLKKAPKIITIIPVNQYQSLGKYFNILATQKSPEQLKEMEIQIKN